MFHFGIENANIANDEFENILEEFSAEIAEDLDWYFVALDEAVAACNAFKKHGIAVNAPQLHRCDGPGENCAIEQEVAGKISHIDFF